MQYDVRYDSESGSQLDSPDFDDDTTRSHDLIWRNTRHLEAFQATTVSFWQQRLQLARNLVRIFALALQLPEHYFDTVTTQPGADALYIHYPPSSSQTGDIDVGIGSHTDIQLFTLLWQDDSGGLQVLSNTDEWLDARPIEGTLVVNVGDFLQRLSNDRFQSTVHRVYNRTEKPRYSMPFFFGFNANAVCEVVPTCVKKGDTVKYKPISCGEVGVNHFLTTALNTLTRSYSGGGNGLLWLRNLVEVVNEHIVRVVCNFNKRFKPTGSCNIIDSHVLIMDTLCLYNKSTTTAKPIAASAGTAMLIFPAAPVLSGGAVAVGVPEPPVDAVAPGTLEVDPVAVLTAAEEPE